LSTTLTHHLPPPLRTLLAPLLSQEPAPQLIRNTTRQQWKLLQALQSLSRLANNVSVGYFAAECRARVTARIHSQVLRFSFPCASGTKVGDLTDDASQGPEAIRIQIQQMGQLLVLLLLSGTVLAVLVGISPWLLLAGGLIGAASSEWSEPGLASPRAARLPSPNEPLSRHPPTRLHTQQDLSRAAASAPKNWASA
jgi:hypothetical protein